MGHGNEDVKEDPCNDFLKAFLPELQKQLFARAQPEGA
jgi:hypothetical protein